MSLTWIFIWGFNILALAGIVVALALSRIRGRSAGIVIVAVVLSAVVNVAVARDLGAQEARWEQFNDELREDAARSG